MGARTRVHDLSALRRAEGLDTRGSRYNGSQMLPSWACNDRAKGSLEPELANLRLLGRLRRPQRQACGARSTEERVRGCGSTDHLACHSRRSRMLGFLVLGIPFGNKPQNAEEGSGNDREVGVAMVNDCGRVAHGREENGCETEEAEVETVERDGRVARDEKSPGEASSDLCHVDEVLRLVRALDEDLESDGCSWAGLDLGA